MEDTTFTVTRVRIRKWVLDALVRYAREGGYSRAGVVEKALIRFMKTGERNSDK